GTHAVSPGGEDHRLHGAARIRDARPAVPLVSDHDREGGAGDVGTGSDQLPHPTERLPIPDHDEMPGLAVCRAGGQVRSLGEASNDVLADLLLLVLADG